MDPARAASEGVLAREPAREPRADENARHAEVLSIVSHDIRAPLGVILAAVSELQDPRVGPLTDEQRALVQLVRRSSERLSRLAANVFFLRRSMSELALSLQPIDLRDVARRVLESFERSGEIAKKPNVVLELPPERVQVEGDAELLLQASTNVLANAIRVARSEIVVSVETDAGVSYLRFDDDGPGIPPALREALFPPPAQTASPSPRERADAPDHPPRGLGLAVTRRIVEAHQGVLTAEARVGREHRPVGTTVRIGIAQTQP
jgi:signal transduction histidine kinase